MSCQVLQLLDRNIGNEGLYNLTPRGHTSWFEFAQLIVESALELGVRIEVGAGPNPSDCDV